MVLRIRCAPFLSAISTNWNCVGYLVELAGVLAAERSLVATERLLSIALGRLATEAGEPLPFETGEADDLVTPHGVGVRQELNFRTGI